MFQAPVFLVLIVCYSVRRSSPLLMRLKSAGLKKKGLGLGIRSKRKIPCTRIFCFRKGPCYLCIGRGDRQRMASDESFLIFIFLGLFSSFENTA